MNKLWGIDLGGTKIEGVVLENALSTKTLARIRIPTEADKGYDHVLSQLRTLIDSLSKEVGERPRALGIGTPGALDPDLQAIKNSNSTCLIGKPLKKNLESMFAVPIVLENDANCFVLAEATHGAARGARSAFGVIMGTGVGGGIVINGKVHSGRQGIAGEWGHNLLEHGGDKCYCGKSGCVEQVVSGPALERFYRKQTGKQLRLPEIVRRAEGNDDPHAKATMDRLARFFGQAISVVINILDPDVVVLGGGVSNVPILYTQGIEEAAKWVFNVSLKTKILKHALGDSAGVFGAAMLCNNIV